MIAIKNQQDRAQWQYLMTPPGSKGSGRVRYAAAMYFYGRKMIGDDALEVFRICAKRDGEDPAQKLAALGLVHEIELTQKEHGQG